MPNGCPKCHAGDNCVTVVETNPGLWQVHCNLCGWGTLIDKRNSHAVGIRKHENLQHEEKWRPCETCGDMFFTKRERFCRICKSPKRRQKRVEIMALMGAWERNVEALVDDPEMVVRQIENDPRHEYFCEQ